MVNYLVINQKTEEFVKKAHKIMRSKGYKMTSSRQSAMVAWDYEKADKPTLSVTGWHGNGKYGKLKMVFSLLETEDWSPKEVAEFDTLLVERGETLSGENYKLYLKTLDLQEYTVIGS
jgi:hypothetical protein